MSSSESVCPGGAGAPSGAGASGFLKKEIITPLSPGQFKMQIWKCTM